MTCDGHRRERASTVVDAARDPATPSKDGIARALHVVVGGGHSVGTRRAADAPRAADIETLSPRRLESARGARRDGRDARRGARVAGGRWLHARQRVSRETSAELSSFFLRCRSEVFPDAPISAVEPTENSRMLRWQGESSCSFRAFRKRAVVFALDFLFSCANTRTIERFVKRTKIPKLEPIRSRLPSFPDPTRREFRLSHRIRRVVRQPLPTHLSILDEFFSVRVFAKWDLRPRVRLGRHTRTHLTSASHTRLRNGCRYHVYGRCHARPRRREQVRLQGHPRLRGRAQEGGWRPRHPPGTNTGDAPPPAPSPGDGRRPRDDRAIAHASRRAPRSKRARVPGVVVASTPRTRGGTGSRDVSKNASHRTDPGSSACRVRERICPGSPRARAAATARFRRRTPRHAPRSSRRAPRASYARATRRTSARGARSPRASTGSLSTRCRLERAVALGPGAPNPGFLSHEPARRKSEKTFRVFSNVAVVFFFVKTAPVPASNPAP